MNDHSGQVSPIAIRPTAPEHAEQLEQLQITVFPTLADAERLKRQHYLKHIELFPEGQFVALDGERVVGMTTSIRLSEKTVSGSHTFAEILQGGWCTSHDPTGEWLYGIDMGTDPEYRGRGIARALYDARHQTVADFGLRGQYTVGMMSGYGRVKEQMSAEAYYQQLLSRELSDPTLSPQMKIGFEPAGLVAEYLEDPVCGNYGVRMILPAAKLVAR